ncbi:MAG: substrate-binding domain-containing protein [Pseudolabrys sp.]
MINLVKGSLIAFTIALPLQARAADIHVLTPPNMKAILTDLTPEFERVSGHKLIVSYAPVPEVKEKIAAGDIADVAIALRPQMDELRKQGKLKDVNNVGRSFIGVAVRAGAPKPDISSRDALKRTLLPAKSITYSDPPKGGIAGVYTAGLIERLGLTEQLKTKTKLVAPGGGPLVEAVVGGDAEIAIDQLVSIANKPGIDVVGTLPKEANVDIVLAAGVPSGSAQPEAAAAFIKFLTSPAAAPTIKARGMEPG